MLGCMNSRTALKSFVVRVASRVKENCTLGYRTLFLSPFWMLNEMIQLGKEDELMSDRNINLMSP